MLRAQGQVSICGQNSSHSVDIKAKYLADSLKKIGVDTLLIYRHWLYKNGDNGYGKVIWLDNGTEKQYQINADKSINYSVIKTDSIFSFYSQTQLDTISSNPTKQSVYISHDADHFVYFDIGGKIYCYHISGLLVECNPTHLRSQFVNRLIVDKRKTFIDGVKNSDK